MVKLSEFPRLFSTGVGSIKSNYFFGSKTPKNIQKYHVFGFLFIFGNRIVICWLVLSRFCTLFPTVYRKYDINSVL